MYSTQGDQNGVSGPLELQLQVIVHHPIWVLGTEAVSSQEQRGLLMTEPSL